MALTTVSQHVVSVNAIQGTLIADNAITAVHIATNAVSGTLIADNAVTATHIAQNTITVTQLADDAVEADKIADGVITTNHLNKAMISSQTEVTPVAGDFVLIGDTSDSNNLKKTPISGITALATIAGISSSADATAITIDSSENCTFAGTVNGLTLAAGSIATSTSQNFALNTPNSLRINIDSNDSATDQVFVIGHNRTDVGTTSSLLVIQEDGKTGIGTASPDDLLDIQGAAYDQIRIGSNKTDNTNKTAGIVSTMYTNNSVSVFQGFFQNGNNAIYYGSADTAHRGLQNHYFYVNSDYNATTGHALAYNIKASGGTGHEWYTSANSNSKKLALHNGEGLYVYNEGGGGSNYGNGSEILLDGLSYNGTATHTIQLSGNLPGYTNGAYNCLKTTLNDLHFVAGGTYTGYISHNTGFTDVSDEREKDNVVTISNATTKLKQLRGVYHTWKDTTNKGDGTHLGLIAQEVEAVIPEVVTTSNPTSLNTPESDTAGLKGVAYAKLVPLLIETIKELEARIVTLEG